jgi:hypothetical protein
VPVRPCAKKEIVVALDAGRTVLPDASDEMVACDIRLMIDGESMGRVRGLTLSVDLERPYRSYQSSDEPPSNDPVLHTDPGVPASGLPESLVVR